MELHTLAVPALMSASLLIYWTGRHDKPRSAFRAGRLVALLSILLVWWWAWANTPLTTYPSPIWRPLTFVPATAGILALMAIEAQRFFGAQTPTR